MERKFSDQILSHRNRLTVSFKFFSFPFKTEQKTKVRQMWINILGICNKFTCFRFNSLEIKQ